MCVLAFFSPRVFADAINSEWLFACWCCTLVIYAHLIANADAIRNAFRIQVDNLEIATHIRIRELFEEEVLVSNVPSVVVAFRRLKTYFASDKKGTFLTVPVQTSEAGTRFIEFRCCRYVIQDGEWRSASPSLEGRSLGELRKTQKSGLAAQKHRSVLEMTGPNTIPFEVDPLDVALRKEFFNYFYLYQFQIYVVWYWFSYLFTAMVMSSIVLAAGLSNIAITRANQKKIKSMTEYQTQVKVLRDGIWSSVDSVDLVPGDVIALQENWNLPCDAVLLSGSAICDESGLTGESMPVRKTAPTADIGTEVYSSHDHARHTLFAGTTLLQIGAVEGSSGAVAVVTATGIHTGKGDLVAQILFPASMTFKYDEELPVSVICLFLYAFVVFILAIIFLNSNGSEKSFVTSWACETSLSPHCSPCRADPVLVLALLSRISHPACVLALSLLADLSARRDIHHKSNSQPPASRRPHRRTSDGFDEAARAGHLLRQSEANRCVMSSLSVEYLCLREVSPAVPLTSLTDVTASPVQPSAAKFESPASTRPEH